MNHQSFSLVLLNSVFGELLQHTDECSTCGLMTGLSGAETKLINETKLSHEHNKVSCLCSGATAF